MTMFKPDEAQRKSLETWYPEDHPLHFDPLHPAIALAGKAGELLDLYKKERFKDGVSWWDCTCGHSKKEHRNLLNSNDESCIWFMTCPCEAFAPKILDELGDLWYYVRILAYQSSIELFTLDGDISDNIETCLIRLNHNCTAVLSELNFSGEIPHYNLRLTYKWLQMILRSLDYTLPELTEQNYDKLKGGDHNGWGTTLENI